MTVAAIMLTGVDDAQTVQDWIDTHTSIIIKHIQIDSAVCWIFYE